MRFFARTQRRFLLRYVSGMAVAMSNTQNSMSMLQIRDGTLNEVNNVLIRMMDLAT